MATPQYFIGRMFDENDVRGRANSPLVSSVTCTVATQNMPVIAAALAGADQMRTAGLTQARFTDMGADQQVSALQRATAAGSDRGRTS